MASVPNRWSASLSSLTAGNVAATGGISKILREKDFTSQFHEGEKTLVGLPVRLQHGGGEYRK